MSEHDHASAGGGGGCCDGGGCCGEETHDHGHAETREKHEHEHDAPKSGGCESGCCGGGAHEHEHAPAHEHSHDDGKPVVKAGDKPSGAGAMDWLNEAVANVQTSLGGNRRGEYASVSTHDEDEDDWRRPSR